MEPLNKLNKIFDITESVIEDATLPMNPIDSENLLYTDFMNARNHLNEIIKIGRSSIGYASAGIDDPRTLEALSTLISSVNSSIKVLMDIYIIMHKLQGEKGDKDGKINKINNQVNIISTNLNEVIASLKS